MCGCSLVCSLIFFFDFVPLARLCYPEPRPRLPAAEGPGLGQATQAGQRPEATMVAGAVLSYWPVASQRGTEEMQGNMPVAVREGAVLIARMAIIWRTGWHREAPTGVSMGPGTWFQGLLLIPHDNHFRSGARMRGRVVGGESDTPL